MIETAITVYATGAIVSFLFLLRDSERFYPKTTVRFVVLCTTIWPAGILFVARDILHYRKRNKRRNNG